MAAVDSTIVLLALFPIATDLKSDFVTIVWVIIAYILMSTALVLSLGRIADMYGRKRMYNTGFVIFTVGSALCGLAPSGITLVLFRGVQGIGAALLVANSFAIVSEAFPPNERGRAFGITSIVWGSGSVLGIILGGVIIAFTSWRLIFLINVPIGIFGTIWAYSVLRETGDAAGKRVETFDIQAAVSFTLALITLLVGITFGLLKGWTDVVTVSSLVCSPFLFGFFLAWESKFSRDPIIDLRLFGNREFSYSVISAFLQSVAIFSLNFLLLFYFEGIDGLPILTASYLVIPMAIMTSLTGPIGGVLSDRFGARTVAAVGLAIQAIVLFILSRLTPSTPLTVVAMAEALYGVGGGLFWPANTSAIMSATPKSMYGVGSGIMNTFRNTGMVLSFAMSLLAATSVIPAEYVSKLFIGSINGKLPTALAVHYLGGQGFAFEISVILLIAATLISLLKGGTSKHGKDLITVEEG